MRWLLVCLFCGGAFAQTFDVAELKLNTSGQERMSADLSNGVLTVRNVSLRILLAEIYMMTPDDISGPAWLDDVRVDILAKAASRAASDGELREMAKALLKERMKMVARIEPRPQTVWALSILKGNHKLMASTLPARPEDAKCTFGTSDKGVKMTCAHMSMTEFSHELPQFAGRYADKRVVDQTGLDGVWEFTVEWTPLAQLEANGGLSLFAALQSQLGLQLESKKLPVPVVVIDSMERTPTDN